VKLWPFIFSVALFTGCAGFHPKPISPDESAASLETRSLADPALKVFLEKNLHRELANWPAGKWDFEMLTLAAYYYHPSLDVARAEWHAAQAGEKTAGGIPNPTLTVTPGYDSTFVKGVNPWFPAINLDVPIETAGKRSKRIAVAEHLSESARLNIASAAWQVRSGVRSALLDYNAAQQRMRLLKKQVALLELVEKSLTQKADVGDIARSELLLPRVTLSKARMDLADAQRQSAEAGVNLAEAIGVSSSALENIQVEFDLQQSPAAANNLTTLDARKQALTSRTDILGALADYAAAEATLRLEIAKQYPDVHLNPGYQFDQGDHKWSLGIGIDLPVFNHNQGPVAEAEAQRASSSARFLALQAKVIAEIDRAVAAYQAGRANLATLDNLTSAQEQQSASAEAQYKAGAIERLDLLSAQSEAAANELTRLEVLVKVQEDFGKLEDALQSPVGWTDALWMTSPRDITKKEQKHE